MMESNQVIPPQPEGTMEMFLAMLSEENMPTTFMSEEVLPQGVQNDDDYCNMALAMSPGDVGQQQSQIDLEEIHNMLRLVDGNLMMETDTSQGMDYQQPSVSSPHMYEVQNDQGFTQLQTLEEVPQSVPVQNPGVMISGVIPMQTTIDQSQLQLTSQQQSVDVDLPVENRMEVLEDQPVTNSVKSEVEEVAPKPDEAPILPDYKELLIRIRYRSQEVVREHVKNQIGCLVYFHKPWQFNNVKPLPAGVEFPDITAEQRSAMTESQFKFTDQVLKALEKGLFLRCDDYGNIYATRFCRSKIFWCSTEKGPIADAQMANLTLQKLERDTPVMVFDNRLFQQRLLHYVVNKPTFKHEASTLPPSRHVIPVSPAVFFTFAQSWNPMNSALSSCLVSMVVNPVRARMQRQWGNEDRHESYDVSNYRLQISGSGPGEKP